MTQGAVFPLSGFIIRWIGRRAAMVGGCVVFSAGAALTHFTIGSGNVWLVALTYGFVSALGQGVALIPTMTIGMRWFPERKGMAMGIVVGGFGGGAFIFNQIQTAILNPDNVAVDPETLYFTDEALLDRVPDLMLVLAGIYLAVEMVACAMITEPPPRCGLGGDGEGCGVKDNCGGGEEKAENGKSCVNGAALPAPSSPASRASSRQSSFSLRRRKKKDDYSSEVRISPRQALKSKEFYILWITR